jgi:hypothetical protein
MSALQHITSFIPSFPLSSAREKKALTNEMLKTWYEIPPSYRKNGELKKYYILRWSLSYFLETQTASTGTLYHQGQRYALAYEKKLPTEKETIAKLSFRCPSVELQKQGLIPTCYVSFA